MPGAPFKPAASGDCVRALGDVVEGLLDDGPPVGWFEVSARNNRFCCCGVRMKLGGSPWVLVGGMATI